jgi:predicted amidohydrolase YtcJ
MVFLGIVTGNGFFDMKKMLLSLIICTITMTSHLSHSASVNPNEITVYVAKKIITMDPSWPEATAVAVLHGKVLSVGSMQDLQPWLSKYPHHIDSTFADKIIMPGFVEAHAHPLIGGTAMTLPLLTYMPIPNPYGPAFPGIKTKAAALAKLAEYAKQTPANQTLISWGYDTTAFGGQLDSSQLDKVSDKLPILVWDASEHLVYANTPALKKYNITNADTKINGLLADANGQPNGKFIGVTAADYILVKALPGIMTPEMAYKNVKFIMDLSRKNGITTTSDLAFGMINFQLEQMIYQKYFNDPNSPMRVVVVCDGVSMTASKGPDAIVFVQGLEKTSTDTLMFHGVKFFADDAFLSQTMVIQNPGYTDQHQGTFITAPDKMATTWLPWWSAGFHIHVHSNGNGGNAATINALSELMLAKPRFDHRFTIEHFGISEPEMPRKIKALGGVVSVNPTYFYARGEINEPGLGTDRADTAGRLKSLLDAGVPTSLHSDTPVAPPNPLGEVWMAVNRIGVSGKLLAPAERITVDQAFRMITIDAAYTLGVENKVGSIAPGKYADFTVLEQDPYAVPVEQIKDISIWGTVHNGVKFAATDIKPL